MRALNVSNLTAVIPATTARGGGVTLVASAQGSAVRKMSVAGLERQHALITGIATRPHHPLHVKPAMKPKTKGRSGVSGSGVPMISVPTRAKAATHAAKVVAALLVEAA